jgi:hypothetical protein
MGFDIVTPEIVKLQIQSLEALVRVADSNIDSYLETLSMFMKADGAFKEADFVWVKGLLESAQYQKEKLLADIEVKKSVLKFMGGN